MITNNGDGVVTCPGIVLWDGIANPNVDEKTGNVQHNLKIAIPANSPEIAELEAMAMKCLTNSEFKGQWPAGGIWPIQDIDLSKLGDSAVLMQGRKAISGKTNNGIPPVYDANGNELSAMQFNQLLYPGAVVELLVHAYAYNNKSKGVAFGLDGVKIVDSTTPKLDVGGGMSRSQVANAFGFAGNQGGQAPGNMPPGGSMPNNMPPGGSMPNNMPPGGSMPNNMPPGGSMPNNMPPGGSMPNNMPQGGQMPNNMPQGGQMPNNMPPVQPNTAFVDNARKQMTPKAGMFTYQEYIDSGYTDARLIAEGLMLP